MQILHFFPCKTLLKKKNFLNVTPPLLSHSVKQKSTAYSAYFIKLMFHNKSRIRATVTRVFQPYLYTQTVLLQSLLA